MTLWGYIITLSTKNHGQQQRLQCNLRYLVKGNKRDILDILEFFGQLVVRTE